MREPDKIRLGLTTAESPIPKLEMLVYNHFRPNMALKGRTPGEAAGLGYAAGGMNKMLALLTSALIFRHVATSHTQCRLFNPVEFGVGKSEVLPHLIL